VDKSGSVTLRYKGKMHHIGVGCHIGVEDGIRTREPHLGKVMDLVHDVLVSPLACGSVHAASSPSAGSAPVVERSTIDRVPQG
jgi:hypothetical protein